MSAALCILQQFSNECRNWMPDYFCQVTVCEIGCQSCTFFSASQRSKTETDFLFTRIFPRFPSFTFVCFEIWLVHWLICVMWLARWNYYVFGLYEVGSKFYPNTTLISVIRSVFLCTERCWNMWIPGFGSDELRPFKKQATTEAHKQVSKRKIYVTVSFSR